MLETSGGTASPETRRAVAECNFEFGEVLAGNNALEAAVPKLRKALDTYRELAGSTSKPATGRSIAGLLRAGAETSGGERPRRNYGWKSNPN